MRDRIINISRELFLKKGIRNVTMTDISAELGISKRTLYEVVKSKDELIEEVMEYLEVEQDKRMKRFNDGSVGILELIKLVIEGAKSEADNEIGVLYHEIKKYHPEIFEKRKKKWSNKRKLGIERMITRGVEQGFFLREINVKLTAELMANLFVSFEEGRFEAILDNNEDVRTMIKAILIIFCRGIGTEKGIKEMDVAFDIKG